MRLRDLDARFLRLSKTEPNTYDIVESLADADGVQFQCPKCCQGKEQVIELPDEIGPDWKESGRRFFRGPHYVICWFVGHVPDDLNPKPGRWTPSGTGLDDLTFVPGNPPRAVSVLLTDPPKKDGEDEATYRERIKLHCGWHGHVVNGDAT
jgi:hypothetical protein